MRKLYTLKELAELLIDGKHILTIADIRYYVQMSRTHIYNILNGKAVIYTSEIRQIVRGMRERGFNITEDDIDFSNLRIKYHSYT